MTERPPLAPVAGLKRTSRIPSPPPRVTSTTATTTADKAATRETAITAPAAARSAPPRPKRPAEPTDRRSDDADTTRALSLSLPLPLVEFLKAYAKTTGTTHADVLLDAVLEHRDQLGSLLDEVKPRTRTDALFVRTPGRRKKDQTYVSLSLRMPSYNVDALDALVTQHEADSRSQLCAAALTAYCNAHEMA